MADKLPKLNSVAAPISKKRNDLFQAMQPSTQKIALELEQKFQRQSTGNVLTQYDVGALIVDVLDNDSQYEPDAIDHIADYLNIPSRATMLYALAGFARAFDKEFVKNETQNALADGSFLKLGHWLALSKLASTKKQEEKLKLTRKRSLTVNELELDIRAESNDNKKNLKSGGRKPMVPTSPAGALQKATNLALTFTNYSEAFDESVFPSLEEWGPDKINTNLRDKLVETINQVDKLQDAASHILTGLKTNLTRVTTILDHKGEETGAEASDEDAPKPKKQKGKTDEKVKVKSKGGTAKRAAAPAPKGKGKEKVAAPTKSAKTEPDKKKVKAKRPVPSSL